MEQNKEKLAQIFSTIFPSEKGKFELDKNRSAFQNWDSLTHMQLISDVESAFKIRFDIDDIIDINTPGDILTIIKKKQDA